MSGMPAPAAAASGPDCLAWPIFGLDRAEKSRRLLDGLSALVQHHRAHCEAYDRILAAHGHSRTQAFAQLEDLPFLPVRLFKDFTLRSVPDAQVVKLLTSSGTGTQGASRIALDRGTALAQSHALVRILQDFLGRERLPMLIIDHPGVVKDRQAFSARAAGVLGFSSFGRDHTYALQDGSMALDAPAVAAFLERHAGRPILLFGFTFMVWRYLLQAARRQGLRLDFSQGLLIHGGGWKKLADEAVDNATFKATLHQQFGLPAVHNYYGMVEQVGSIFMECGHGRLHAPAFADVIVRHPQTWAVQPPGQAGLLQVLSLLPHSYPGHSLLTEDLGELIGEDDCPCGRLGKTFAVHGRIPRAEARGCSDTHVAAPAAEALVGALA